MIFTSPIPDPFIFGPVDCFGKSIYLVLVEGVLAVIFLIIAVVLLWNTEDRFHLKSELKLLIFLGIPVLIVWAIFNFAPKIPKPFSTDVYIWIMIFYFYFISVLYPLWLSYNDRWLRDTFGFKKATNTSAAFTHQTLDEMFASCLESPVLLEKFKKFCGQSWCLENLLFYIECHEFQELHQDEKRIEKARYIVNSYIIENAPSQINIDGDVRTVILSEFESGIISPDLFVNASKHVYDQMKLDTFCNWIKTPGFRTALEEANMSGPTSGLDRCKIYYYYFIIYFIFFYFI